MLDALATLALGELAALGILRGGPVPATAEALALAGATLIAALWVAPDARAVRYAHLAPALARSVAAGAAAGVLIVANVGWQLGPARVLGLTLGVAVLALTFASAMRVVGDLTGSVPRGRLAIGLGVALTGTAPVWLGPALERLEASQTIVDAIVAASPLTYLAVMSGYDYLHQQWFYVHSPVASLRFAYPAPITSTAGYLAIALALLSADRHLPERWRKA
jgi:hypothetical protein